MILARSVRGTLWRILFPGATCYVLRPEFRRSITDFLNVIGWHEQLCRLCSPDFRTEEVAACDLHRPFSTVLYNFISGIVGTDSRHKKTLSPHTSCSLQWCMLWSWWCSSCVCASMIPEILLFPLVATRRDYLSPFFQSLAMILPSFFRLWKTITKSLAKN